ncbi:MAG: PAS domain S-box protein, partial [Polyangiaceae bacterium]|nr:PAS domain S-box protein [Polyangiaceae bacterium]
IAWLPTSATLAEELAQSVRGAERRRIDLLLRVTLAGWVAYGALYVALGRWQSAAIQAGVAGLTLLLRGWALGRPTLRQQATAHLAMGLSTAGLTVLCLFAGENNVTGWFLVAVPMFLAFMRGERAALAWAGVVAVCMVAAHLANHFELVAREYPTHPSEALIGRVVLMLIVVSFAIVARRADDTSAAAVNRAAEHRVEAALAHAAAETRVRTLFERIADGQIILDPDASGPGAIGDCNPAAVDMLGASSKAALAARGLHAFFPERQPDGALSSERFAELCASAHASGARRFEWTFARPDGTLVPADVTLSTIDLEGTRTLLLGAHDITRRKRIEDTMRQSEERHRASLHAMPDLVFRVRVDGTYLDFKPRAEAPPASAVARATSDRFVGRNLRDGPLPPDVRRRVGELVAEAVASAEPRSFEFELDGADGIEQHEARIVRSGADEAVCIVRDVTEKKAVERMKDEFASTVSHELRTPLTSIRGSLGLLEAGVSGPLGDRALELVRIARTGCDRLIRLVNDLLDLERLEGGHGRLVLGLEPVAELVETATTEIASVATAAGVTLRCELAPEVAEASVSVDRDRIHQVLTNLLSNAIRFAPRGSTVRLRVGRGPRRGLQIAVLDEGPGVPESDRDKLFQRFQQLGDPRTRKQGGTGLGLAICKAIVEQHGGTIGVDSRKSGGAAFFFELPAERG